MQARLAAVSFALTIAAAVFLLVWPAHSGFDGNRLTRTTLVEINGPWAIIPVIFPVLAALLPLILRRRTVPIIATILVGGFVLITGFSIGLAYLPAAVTMLLATCVTASTKVSGTGQ